MCNPWSHLCVCVWVCARRLRMCAPLHLHLSSNMKKIQLLRLNEVPLITRTLKGLFQQKKTSGAIKRWRLPSLHKTFLSGASFFIWGTERTAPAVELEGPKGEKERQRETENKRWIRRKTDGKTGETAEKWECESKRQKKEERRKELCEPRPCFQASNISSASSHSHTHVRAHTHWPRFGVLYKIFCLLPQSCKITPLHCAHPQHSQPCTNINKQTHTPTHTHRPPKSDIWQIGEYVVSLLSFI